MVNMHTTLIYICKVVVSIRYDYAPWRWPLWRFVNIEVEHIRRCVLSSICVMDIKHNTTSCARLNGPLMTTTTTTSATTHQRNCVCGFQSGVHSLMHIHQRRCERRGWVPFRQRRDERDGQHPSHAKARRRR